MGKVHLVRYDEATDELYIARENYNEDINSNDWELLSNTFKEIKYGNRKIKRS